ncbi:Phage polarity suppression protein (Psu) [Raoultella planticola]|uniref:Phage polarity suppression protein (Psu) n=2 Tax=Klebsiella/Raoultella group TaxID=2890311 RepID=A0A485BX11_RAOPL|nr:Phage polarity suppression protein (Psu) [Raoultella planticola]
MQTLRDIIDVKKWEINQAAGRYIRAHEAVQRISIRNRLNDFMQAHGSELAATLAPELMGLSQQPALLTGHALDRSAHYLREALSVWLSTGEEINYSAEDSDILTAIGFRPDAASRVDNQEKYTPATEPDLCPPAHGTGRQVAPQEIPENTAIFPELSHASTGCMVLHALSRPVTPFATLSRRGLSLPMLLHEKPTHEAAGEAGKALRASGKVFI